jgi:signal transduction histidine kinase
VRHAVTILHRGRTTYLSGSPVIVSSQRARTLVALIVTWSVLVALFAGGNYLSRVSAGIPAAWTPAFIWSAAQWYAWAMLAPLIFLLGAHARIESIRSNRAIAVHVLAMPAFVVAQVYIERVLLFALLALARLLPGDLLSGTTTTVQPALERLQRGVGFGVFTFGVIVLAGHAMHFYRQLASRERRALHLERELLEARLDALRSQLQPHFLFNTLNSIAGLLHSNARAADRMLMNLSDLLRRVLDGAVDSTIADELALTDAYLEIESQRLGARLKVRKLVEQQTLGVHVPSMLLQPLVENAVRHGVQAREEGGTIEISSTVRDGKLELRVWNDVGVEGGTSQRGIGLSNTRARLAAFYGDTSTFTASAEESSRGFLVTMQLPLSVASPRLDHIMPPSMDKTAA